MTFPTPNQGVQLQHEERFQLSKSCFVIGLIISAEETANTFHRS